MDNPWTAPPGYRAVIIDALLANLDRARTSPIFKQLGLTEGEYAYITLHRPSNVDGEAELRSVIRELRSVAENIPVVFPMHPHTRKMCEHFGIFLGDSGMFDIVDPIGYHKSLRHTESAKFVLTDSGGL